MTSTVAPPRWGTLGEIADIVMGQSPVGTSYNKNRDGVPLINGPTEFTTRHPVAKQWTTAPVRFCQADDVLICVRGSSTGRTNIADTIYCIGRGVAAVRASAPNEQTFVQYALAAVVADLLKLQTGSTFPSIDSRVIRGGSVLIPEPAEQRRIGRALLDADDLIASIERLIAKKQAVKQAMMQQLLTGKTRLLGFEKPWKERLLGDHVSYIATVALSRAQLDLESPTRYLHYGDIHTRADVRLDAVREPTPRARSQLLRNAGRLQIGDLVFADASEDKDGVGKSVEITAVPETGVVAGLHTIAARFDKSVLADGFKAYLQFIPSFRDALLRQAAGTKVLATTRSSISSITVKLPNVAEQRAIASVLRDVETEIQHLKTRLTKARDVKQGMMQELLTGHTRLSVEIAP